MNDALSPLEKDLMAFFHANYQGIGVPAPTAIAVRRRRNTGAGRYVQLVCDANIEGPNRSLDMKGGYLEMEGIADGLMAVLWVEGHRLKELEIAVYGEQGWDGREVSWKIVR